MSNNDLVNSIDHSDLTNEPHNQVENAPVAIPDTTVPLVGTQRGKMHGVGTVVRAAEVKAKVETEKVRVDGRSQEILDTLRSLVHGFKGNERYIFDARDYMKTIVANQEFIMARLNRVLDLMGEEGIDFKQEVELMRSEMRESAETIRQATLAANPEVKVQQPGPKSDRFNATAMDKVYKDNAAQAIAAGKEIPPAAANPTAAPAATVAPTGDAPKKKGKPFAQRGGTAFMMLEALYRSGNYALPRTTLYEAVASKVANPYPVLLSLSTNTPPFVTVEGRGDKTVVKITEAGIAHFNKEQADEAAELIAKSQEDPDNAAFRPSDTVCDNNASEQAQGNDEPPF